MVMTRALVVALAMMAAPVAHSRPGGRHVTETEEGWKDAERVVRDYYSKVKGWTVSESHREKLPYLFHVSFDGGGGQNAIAYAGKFADGTGLPALADYLKHIDAHKRRLTVDDWIALMYYFEAWPDPARGLSTFMMPYVEVEARNPTFVMAYTVATPEGTAGDVPATRYTLEVAPSYKLEWRAAQIVVSRALWDQAAQH